MKTFQFYQDQKVSVWRRTHFSFQAQSYGHAVGRLKASKNVEINKQSQLNKNIVLEASQILYDTMEGMTTADNGGESTLEFYDEQGCHITDNEPDKETDNHSLIMELACELAEKEMVDTLNQLPESFMNESGENYTQYYQDIFIPLYDKYYDQLIRLNQIAQ